MIEIILPESFKSWYIGTERIHKKMMEDYEVEGKLAVVTIVLFAIDAIIFAIVK